MPILATLVHRSNQHGGGSLFHLLEEFGGNDSKDVTIPQLQ
jgi:hypothetical protein